MVWRANQQFRRFRRDRRGASAVEYALLVAGIGITVMAVINFFSAQIVSVQTQITTAIQTNNPE